MQTQDSGKKVTIHGRVQGVGMRYYLMGNARALGLSGWVRNCPDGTVECVAQGEPSAVQQFVTAAEQGPPLARIMRVETYPVHYDPSLSDFTVRY